MKTIHAKIIQTMAIQAMGRPQRPSDQGPGYTIVSMMNLQDTCEGKLTRNASGAAARRAAMGIPYAKYGPMIASEKIALVCQKRLDARRDTYLIAA
jgi:hypothetical protein